MSDLAGFLTRERDSITTTAQAALERAHSRHYDAEGAAEMGRRLAALFDQLVGCIATRRLTSIVEYAEGIAEERFTSGYDIAEVQGAFNSLEEAAWLRVLECLPPTELAEALGLISTVLGAAKDALARKYVSLASEEHVPSLDLRALFEGAA